MVSAANLFPSVIRTERGLSVGGRRLTLYLLEDHFRAGWPAELVRDWFNLSEQEIADVLGYIAANRVAFDEEYEKVVIQAEEQRKYWEERNRPLLEEIRQSPASPELASQRARLEALRSERR